jgi:hypothetical protein
MTPNAVPSFQDVMCARHVGTWHRHQYRMTCLHCSMLTQMKRYLVHRQESLVIRKNWNQPKKFEDHIIMIGTFHVVCAYFKMIGKKMEGTGLSDILLEAGLIGSGSVTGVMTGKHYSRAMHCHKILLEALEKQTRQTCTATSSTSM